jgi:hypothetical protein
MQLGFHAQAVAPSCMMPSVAFMFVLTVFSQEPFLHFKVVSTSSLRCSLVCWAASCSTPTRPRVVGGSFFSLGVFALCFLRGIGFVFACFSVFACLFSSSQLQQQNQHFSPLASSTFAFAQRSNQGYCKASLDFLFFPCSSGTTTRSTWKRCALGFCLLALRVSFQ